MRTAILISAAAGLSLTSPSGGQEIALSYTADILANLDGGLDQGVRYMDLAFAEISREFAPQSGPAVSLYASALYANGESITGDLVGDAQAISSIETGFSTLRLYEAWADVRIDAVSLRAGLYDLNTEFDVIDTAGLFLNGAHGIGADIGLSGANGPSIFPFTGVAVRAAYTRENTLFQIAALDAEPGDPDDPRRVAPALFDDGALLIGEVRHQVGALTVLAGAWAYSRAETLTGQGGDDWANAGAYVRAEYGFPDYRGPGTLSGFARLGFSDDRYNTFEHYAGAGLVLTGPFARRPDDQLGLAVSWAGLGDAAARLAPPGAAAEGELNIEFTYAIAVNRYIEIQPDLQYVSSPSASRTLDDALVAGMRVSISN